MVGSLVYAPCITVTDDDHVELSMGTVLLRVKMGDEAKQEGDWTLRATKEGKIIVIYKAKEHWVFTSYYKNIYKNVPIPLVPKHDHKGEYVAHGAFTWALTLCIIVLLVSGTVMFGVLAMELTRARDRITDLETIIVHLQRNHDVRHTSARLAALESFRKRINDEPVPSAPTTPAPIIFARLVPGDVMRPGDRLCNKKACVTLTDRCSVANADGLMTYLGSFSSKNCTLAFQDDHNLVMLAGSFDIWASHTENQRTCESVTYDEDDKVRINCGHSLASPVYG